MVSGAETFLAKPVDTGELIKRIEQTLSPTVQPQRNAFSLHL